MVLQISLETVSHCSALRNACLLERQGGEEHQQRPRQAGRTHKAAQSSNYPIHTSRTYGTPYLCSTAFAHLSTAVSVKAVYFYFQAP